VRTFCRREAYLKKGSSPGNHTFKSSARPDCYPLAQNTKHAYPNLRKYKRIKFQGLLMHPSWQRRIKTLSKPIRHNQLRRNNPTCRIRLQRLYSAFPITTQYLLQLAKKSDVVRPLYNRVKRPHRAINHRRVPLEIGVFEQLYSQYPPLHHGNTILISVHEVNFRIVARGSLTNSVRHHATYDPALI
jgi:hypothetical protein